MAIDPRRQVYRNPYMPQRKDMADYFGGDNGRIKGYSQKQRYGGGGAGGDSFNPSAMFTNPLAMAMGAYNIGLQADASGTLQPTQDFGQMATLQSQQLNSLSPGVDPRQQTSLGKPLGAMYAMNPNTWKNRPGGTAGFGDAVSQRNQTFAEQFKIPDYTGGQQTSAGQPSGGIPNPLRSSYAGPYRPGFSGTTEQQKVQNRAALQEQVDAKRMLGQATGDMPTMQGIGLKGESISTNAAPKIGEARNISGKYGTGFATFEKPGTKKEGLINGRPASEVLQGLANKPGIARAGDRFQPQKSTPAESKAMNTALSKLPMKNPLLKK